MVETKVKAPLTGHLNAGSIPAPRFYAVRG